MKAALFFFVVVAAAALAQAADYNGVVAVEKANLAFSGSCLLTAVREAFLSAVKVVGVCISEPRNISVCVLQIVPQVFEDARLAYTDCTGTA